MLVWVGRSGVETDVQLRLRVTCVLTVLDLDLNCFDCTRAVMLPTPSTLVARKFPITVFQRGYRGSIFGVGFFVIRATTTARADVPTVIHVEFFEGFLFVFEVVS